MKRVLTLIIMTAFTIVVFAGAAEAQEKSQNPKATNYKEVLKDIKYPQVCREKGIEGTVIVALKISEKGDIMDYQFKKTPCDDLQLVVESSLDKLKFEPARNEKGQAVVGKLYLPVNFKLSI